MRGLTISSLVFIFALSSTVAVAAPRAAVSPVPNIASVSCKKSGLCSFSNPETCCGACVLIDTENGYCQDDSATCKIRGACNSLSPPHTCCGSCILIDSFNGFCLV